MGMDNHMDDLDINCCDIFDSDIADSYDTYDTYDNQEIEYREIPGYERYRIYKDGTIKTGWEINERTLKHVILKNKDGSRRGGPRVNLSKNGHKRSFLVAKILFSVFKDTDYDFLNDKADIWYKDNNPRNLSLDNLY